MSFPTDKRSKHPATEEKNTTIDLNTREKVSPSDSSKPSLIEGNQMEDQNDKEDSASPEKDEDAKQIIHLEFKPQHRYPLLILESHLDTFGHVNHATYLQLMEEARWDLVTNQGYGVEKIRETGLGPIILEVKISFKRELRLRQKIFIETGLLSYTRKTATIQQQMVSEAGKVHARADVKFGLFDVRRRKLVTPTPEWLRTIGVPI